MLGMSRSLRVLIISYCYNEKTNNDTDRDEDT
jgi:hypothetical protein